MNEKFAFNSAKPYRKRSIKFTTRGLLPKCIIAFVHETQEIVMKIEEPHMGPFCLHLSDLLPL